MIKKRAAPNLILIHTDTLYNACEIGAGAWLNYGSIDGATASEERGEFALVRRLATAADIAAAADVVEVTLVAAAAAADAVAVLRGRRQHRHGQGYGNGHGDGHRGVGGRFRIALHQ